MSPWLREVVQLVHAGLQQDAIARVRARANEGNLAGSVRLAIFGEEAGCEYEEKARKALRHLEAYAELLSDPLAAYAVAVRYGQGNIGTPPNEPLASAWMERAAKFGHPRALQFIQRRRNDLA